MRSVTRSPGAAALLAVIACGACSEKSDQARAAVDAAVVLGDVAPVSCNGKGTPFALPVSAKTPNGEFTVTLTASDPSMFNMGDNAWTLRIDDASGQPAPGLSFNVVPWMTAHNHGSVKVVLVTELGDGEYEAKPININMSGIWDIRVDFPTDGAAPLRAVFSFCASDL